MKSRIHDIFPCDLNGNQKPRRMSYAWTSAVDGETLNNNYGVKNHNKTPYVHKHVFLNTQERTYAYGSGAPR